MTDSTFREKKDKKDVKEEIEIMEEIKNEASLEPINSCTSFWSLQK